MNKRTVLMLFICVLVAVVGCRKAKPTAGLLGEASATPVPEQKPSATPVPPTVAPTTAPTKVPTPQAEAKEVKPTNTPAGPSAPVLLAPPDGSEGTALDLEWSWDGELGPDDWFEVQLWPNSPDGQPKVVWVQETKLRLTSAGLLPGPYGWRVVVVRRPDRTRLEELSPYSEQWSVIVSRPSTKGEVTLTPGKPSPTVTPTPSRTKTRVPTALPTKTHTPSLTPTGTWTPPTPTNTLTRTPTSTPTHTPIPPTPSITGTLPAPTNTLIRPSSTPTGTPVAPTNTPYQPAPTSTNTAPAPTNTPLQPTLTNTPLRPAPTNTSTVPAPTNTPEAKYTETPTPQG